MVPISIHQFAKFQNSAISVRKILLKEHFNIYLYDDL